MSELFFILCLAIFAAIGWGLLIFVVLRNSDYDGQIIITKSEAGKHTFVLELEKDPMDLLYMNHASFKIVGETILE